MKQAVVLLALFVLPLFVVAESAILVPAVEKGDLEEVKRLIGSGAKVDDIDEQEGTTALVAAAKFGKVEIVKFLLEAKANIEIGDSTNGATPLMWASITNPGKVALRKGIPIPTVESKIEIVRILLAAGAKVNAKNTWGGTALQWAADAGNADVVQMLVQAKADVNTGDQDGLAPLMAAANYNTPNHVRITQMLLKAGADVRARNKEDETPLWYAINSANKEMVEILITAGADVNARNKAGVTPLMRAAQLARSEIMVVLIKAGADVNAKNSEGLSVLAVAKKAGYKDPVRILQEHNAAE